MTCDIYIISHQMNYFLIYLGIISFATFIVFGIDKYKAKNGLWRLSENQLLCFVGLGGGLGALAGMEVFRHKTIKGAFLWKFWLIMFVRLIVGCYLLLLK